MPLYFNELTQIGSAKTHEKSSVKEVPLHVLKILEKSPDNRIHSFIYFPEISFRDIK